MKKLFTFCLAMATTLCVNAETINNHEYVDLGLPSGLRWATTNVGATNPEDYGNYYAWGETATKDSYTWETYTLADGGYGTLTKYCNEASYGTVDNKTTLEATDDAATQIWRGAWRMPTDDEWQELLGNCDWTWTTQNSVNGYEVKATNGSSIFLPAAGFRDGDNLYAEGTYGGYWSSSLYTGYPENAQSANLYSTDRSTDNFGRIYGRPVRPVIMVYGITIAATTNGSVEAAKEAYAGQEVALTIKPDAGYELESISVKDADNKDVTVSEDNKFTMPAGAVTVSATFKKPDTKEYVDLGLPSGLLWATCNVGASAPEIYGNYYAWGETTTKETYTWDSYKYTSAPTKYNKSDELLTLEAEDDAAAVNWGGKWRMPTDAEMIELRTNCDWTWTNDYNGTGVAGCIVASKTNGNSIFLPAASYYGQNGIDQIGGNGAYWSSSRTDNVYQAHHTYFYYESGSAKIDDYTYYRNYGHSIRPVQEVVKYAVTVTTPENGTVTADMTTAAAGKTVTLTITPATGYELESISVKDADNVYPVSTDYKFTMPASEVTVSATFKKIDYAINIANNIENGKVSVTSGATTANYGDEVALTIEPAIGYELDKLTVEDANNNTITVTDNKFTMPASAVTVSATFKKIDYAINIANNIENGKVSVASGATTANYGDEVTLTITPDKGYELDVLYVKDAAGIDVMVSANNKFTMPASEVTVTATFKKAVPTALQDAEIAEIYANNGTIYGAEGMQIFTITGQNVTEMNGLLNGVYIVKIGNAAQKIVVR